MDLRTDGDVAIPGTIGFCGPVIFDRPELGIARNTKDCLQDAAKRMRQLEHLADQRS